MKTLILALSVVLVSSCAREVGNGEVITKSVKTDSFTQIALENSADVQIIKGDTLSVEISDYENIIDNISLEVHNSTLEIKKRPGFMRIRNSKAKITIVVPHNISDIDLSGSGNIELLGSFGEDVLMQVTGSGNITSFTENTFNNLEVIVTGSGNVELTGTAKKVDSEISGSGEINLLHVQTEQAHCVITGSGDIRVNPTVQLDAIITGSGNIQYMGNPGVSATITGSGKVDNL